MMVFYQHCILTYKLLLHTFTFLVILTSRGIHTKSALKVCSTIIIVFFNKSSTPIIIICVCESLHYFEAISWHPLFNYTIVVVSLCLHRYCTIIIMLLCYYAFIVIMPLLLCYCAITIVFLRCYAFITIMLRHY
jgi:hypothetical protein